MQFVAFERWIEWGVVVHYNAHFFSHIRKAIINRKFLNIRGNLIVLLKKHIIEALLFVWISSAIINFQSSIFYSTTKATEKFGSFIVVSLCAMTLRLIHVKGLLQM